MQSGTRQVIQISLEADGSVTPEERARILAAVDGSSQAFIQAGAPLLNFTEAAEALGVSRSTFRRMLKSVRRQPTHVLQPIRLPGLGTLRWTQIQLNQFATNAKTSRTISI